MIVGNDDFGLRKVAEAVRKLNFLYDEVTNKVILDITGVPDPQQFPDRIAQLLVDKPLLVLDRKFDIRVFILIRSFVPFEAYMHELFYARLANNVYTDETEKESDNEAIFTVSAYNENEEIANKQHRLIRRKLRFALEMQARSRGRTLNWNGMLCSIRGSLKSH